MKTNVRYLVIALVSAVALAVSVSAHMAFEKSSPAADSTITAPPPSIQVWFTEAPDATVSKMELTGPSGAVTLSGFHVMGDKSIMALVADPMPDGAYAVAWQSAGTDGHIQKGEFGFTVKTAQ